VAEPVEEVRGYSKSGLKSSSKADKKGSSKGSDNKSASKSGRADKKNQNKKWSGNKNKNEIKQVSGTVLLAIGAGVAALLIAVFTCTLFMGGETEQDKQKKQAALINSAATAQTEELKSAHIDRYVRDPNATQTTSKILTYNGKIYADDELSKQYPGMTVFDFPDDDQIGTIDYCTDEQAKRIPHPRSRCKSRKAIKPLSGQRSPAAKTGHTAGICPHPDGSRLHCTQRI
jgi:hypothetical protein